jgi:hypothetical protein
MKIRGFVIAKPGRPRRSQPRQFPFRNSALATFRAGRLKQTAALRVESTQGNQGDQDMSKVLRFGVLLTAFGMALTGCMQGGPMNAYQAQYVNDFRHCPPGLHSQTSPGPEGYWCVLDR